MRIGPLLCLPLIGTAVLVLPAVLADEPAGGDFVVGSQLNTDRQAAFTARLGDGRVIVFGGHGDGWSTPDTAEVATVPGAWTELQMNGSRDLGAGCVLADGRVLLAGGSLPGGNVPGYATAEIFDPATDTFTPTGSMGHARGGAAAALLSTGDVLVVGSWYDSSGAAVAEVYDVTTGTFSLTGSLSHPRAYPLVVPCDDGKALVIGGSGPFGGAISPVESFDAATGQFTVLQDGLFPPDTDWNSFGATETAHDVAFHRLSDGRYVFLANRHSGGIYTYRLYTVDPATQQIAELVTSPALPNADGSGGWYIGPLVSPDGARVHVFQFVTMSAWRLLTVDVATGDLTIPSGTWTALNDQFPAPASLAVLQDGRLLLAGGRVQSGGGNASSSGDTLVITPDAPPSTDPPDAPSDLAVVPQWVDRMQLDWTDGSFDENGFRIERRMPGEGYAVIDTVGPNVTTFTDSTVLPATSYEYRVCAYNVHGDSAFTTAVAGGTPGGKLKLLTRTLNFGRVRIGDVKTKILKLKNKDKQFPAMVDLTMPTGSPFRFVEGGGLVVVPPRGKVTATVEFRPDDTEKVKTKVGYDSTARDMEKLKDLLLKLKGRGK